MFKTYQAVVNFWLNGYTTDDNITTADGDIQNFRQRALGAAEYAQQLWARKVRCGSVYNEKILEGLYMEGVNQAIFWSLRQRRSELYDVSLEKLAQEAESFADSQK